MKRIQFIGGVNGVKLMYKNFYNKYNDSHVSQRYELQKYEYYRDLEYDFLKYLEDLSNEDQSQSNSSITSSYKLIIKEVEVIG